MAEFRYFGDGFDSEPITFHEYDVDGCQVFPAGDAPGGESRLPFSPLMINSAVSILEFYLESLALPSLLAAGVLSWLGLVEDQFYEICRERGESAVKIMENRADGLRN